MPLLFAILLSAGFSGESALDHARKLAALGPHPWGSPKGHAAALYVESLFRDAGLGEVRLEEFDSEGIRGTNVIGVLRAPGPDLIVVGAHHDSAPGAPGAYDDGGGVGVLVEVARSLAQEPRSRTLVFVSWDAEEAPRRPEGSSAYVHSLGAQSQQVVAALDLEMCGWKGGSPVLHPFPYPDPHRPGGYVIAPAWLVAAALRGARDPSAALGVGDPLLSWIYQPAVRTFRVRLYGDDISFLRGGVPALFTSDSSFSAFYPFYHQPTDTAAGIDASSLERMGRSVLGVLSELDKVQRGPSQETSWFAARGMVMTGGALLGLGALCLLPGLFQGFATGGFAATLRILHGFVFGTLMWRHPVPTLWVLLLPAVLSLGHRLWLGIVSVLPALALGLLGLAAWHRGFVEGVWLQPWEIFLMALGLILPWVRPPRPAGRKAPSRRR